MSGSQFGGHLLIKTAASRAQQKQWTGRVNVFDTSEYRFGAHHHACSPTEGRVIYRAMDIGCVLTHIVATQIEQTILTRFTEQTLRTKAIHNSRKDGEDIDSHGVYFASSKTSNKPSGGLIFTMNEPSSPAVTFSTNNTGTKAPDSSSKRSFAGFFNTAIQIPRSTP